MDQREQHVLDDQELTTSSKGQRKRTNNQFQNSNVLAIFSLTVTEYSNNLTIAIATPVNWKPFS
jgi:hypothetical protein